MNNGSAFTICPTEDKSISPTSDPEPTQPSPHCMGTKPEPTADGESEPTTMNEPDLRTEPTIAPEPEPPRESDHVCEQQVWATFYATVGLLGEFEGMETPPTFPPLKESSSWLLHIILKWKRCLP